MTLRSRILVLTLLGVASVGLTDDALAQRGRASDASDYGGRRFDWQNDDDDNWGGNLLVGLCTFALLIGLVDMVIKSGRSGRSTQSRGNESSESFRDSRSTYDIGGEPVSFEDEWLQMERDDDADEYEADGFVDHAAWLRGDLKGISEDELMAVELFLGLYEKSGLRVSERDFGASYWTVRQDQFDSDGLSYRVAVVTTKPVVHDARFPSFEPQFSGHTGTIAFGLNLVEGGRVAEVHAAYQEGHPKGIDSQALRRLTIGVSNALTGRAADRETLPSVGDKVLVDLSLSESRRRDGSRSVYVRRYQLPQVAGVSWTKPWTVQQAVASTIARTTPLGVGVTKDQLIKELRMVGPQDVDNSILATVTSTPVDLADYASFTPYFDDHIGTILFGISLIEERKFPWLIEAFAQAGEGEGTERTLDRGYVSAFTMRVTELLTVNRPEVAVMPRKNGKVTLDLGIAEDLDEQGQQIVNVSGFTTPKPKQARVLNWGTSVSTTVQQAVASTIARTTPIGVGVTKAQMRNELRMVGPQDVNDIFLAKVTTTPVDLADYPSFKPYFEDHIGTILFGISLIEERKLPSLMEAFDQAGEGEGDERTLDRGYVSAFTMRVTELLTVNRPSVAVMPRKNGKVTVDLGIAKDLDEQGQQIVNVSGFATLRET